MPHLHSNAQQCTPHHSTLAFVANSTARMRTCAHKCTRHHSTARRRTRRHSTAQYAAHGTLAALGAVLPRATDAPRYGQQGMPDRTKAGPRLLSFIYSEPFGPVPPSLFFRRCTWPQLRWHAAVLCTVCVTVVSVRGSWCTNTLSTISRGARCGETPVLPSILSDRVTAGSRDFVVIKRIVKHDEY